MWEALPIEKIPEDVSEEKIIYGDITLIDCIIMGETKCMAHNPRFEDLRNFYMWEKIVSYRFLNSLFASFRGYKCHEIILFDTDKNIQFPEIFPDMLIKFINNNIILFQLQNDDEIIYARINIKIDDES